MTLAGDHSTAGAVIGGTLKQQGFKGLIRYACEGRGNVNITGPEAHDLKANGIPVGVVCEHEANWLMLPGVARRMLASQHIAVACGLPEGVVYAAADFDATNGGPTRRGSTGDHNMHAIAGNLEAAGAQIGQHNVWFYGSYFAIDWLVHNAPHLCGGYWQTAAWSRGLLHPRAAFYQYARSRRVAGVDVDINAILKPNWGQRVSSPPAPPRPPNPYPHIPPRWQPRRRQAYNVGWNDGDAWGGHHKGGTT